MMIFALPPLITRFGTGRLPWTVAIVNVGLFGATTFGPIVGGVVAGADAWRTLMWLVAAIGLLALVSAALGYPVLDPLDPDLPFDRSALVLTAVASLLIFTATSLLVTVVELVQLYLASVAGKIRARPACCSGRRRSGSSWRP
jgi:predicted MFS family arabinose efflux permease